MKKLILVAIFSIGIFSISNAQFLTYSLFNSSTTSTWDYAMDDAGPTPPIYELGILPLQTRTGFIANFFFQLEFKCQNSSGCGTNQLIPGPTAGVSVPIICVVPAGVKYKVVEVIPFVLYDLQLKFG